MKDKLFEMGFAYSCGLTDYSTVCLEIWILHTWTVGEGKGRAWRVQPGGPVEPVWVLVVLAAE